MTTLRKYVDVVKAEMDKSLLEAAGIPAFIAGENSASIGYGSILAEVHLQVQDTDVDRARQVFQDNKEAIPLSDDFIPPAVPSLPDDSIPKAASQQQDLETADSDILRIVGSVIITLLAVVAMFAAFRWWTVNGATFYYNRGVAKQVKGNLDSAIASYDRAIELNDRYTDAYNNRGSAKKSKGNLDGAIADFDRAIELDAGYAYAYNNRGMAKQGKGNLDGAILDYNRSIGLDPENAHAYYNRGSVKESKGDLDDAIADFDRAIELNAGYAYAYNNRGMAKQGKSDLDGAIVDFNRSIELDPKNAQAYYNRGNARRTKGDLDGALVDFNKVIELNPKNVNAYYGRGVVHYNKRDWNDALSDFRKASTLRPAASKSETLPDYTSIRIWMTRSKLGERNTATNELKEYLVARTTGKPGDWSSTIARFLTGDVSESDFLKAAENGNEKQTRNQRGEAYFYIGTLRLLDGDKSAAADYFKKCLETEAKDYYEYQSASAELEALKQ